MRKNAFYLIVFVIVVCLCSCAHNGTNEDFIKYTSFDMLDSEYTPGDAVTDNCVVFVDSKIISGHSIWANFITKIDKGLSCNIRIANFSSDNTLFSLIDLSYSGSSFSVLTNDGLSKNYQYINHYEIEADNDEANYSTIDCYILTNQDNITYKDIEKSLASSILDDAIDHLIVYYDMR